MNQQGKSFFNSVLDVGTIRGKIAEVLLFSLNLYFCALFVLETYAITNSVKQFLFICELVIVAVFVVEYIVRLLAAPSRKKYVISIYSIIDIISIIPTLSVLIFPLLRIDVDIGFIRIVRIFKVIRIIRFMRFTADPHFFFGRIGGHLLKVMRFILLIMILFFISSGLFYFMESGSNNDVNNYGDAFYYTVVALTTVGFGDITPRTQAGKLVTVLMILTGIVMIPWQASRIVREWMHLSSKVEVTCKKCGLQYHDRDASHCKHCGSIIYQETIGE